MGGSALLVRISTKGRTFTNIKEQLQVSDSFIVLAAESQEEFKSDFSITLEEILTSSD